MAKELSNKKRLVVIMGLPRSGKNWTALLVSAVLGVGPDNILGTDSIRQEMIQSGEIPYELRYAPESMGQVYERMMQKAKDMLASGLDVIVHATFTREENRLRMRRLAKELEARFYVIYINCGESIIRQRTMEGIPLAGVDSNGSDLPSVCYPADDSEAGWEVYEAIKKAFVPVKNPNLTIDGSLNSLEIMKELNSYFNGERMPALF